MSREDKKNGPRCPECKKLFRVAESPEALPFCSKRCKLLDLSTWLNEGYRVPAEESSPSAPSRYSQADQDENYN